MAPALAQRFAEAVLQDGVDAEDLEKLRGLGSTGKYVNNVERDYHRALAPQPSVKPVGVELPMLDRKSREPSTGRVYALKPLEVFDEIIGQLGFKRIACGMGALGFVLP